MIERIGPYRILRRLGEGGMGVVYAAVDERLDRPVALKWMREAVSDPGARERFMREARAAASVSHPHICPIYALDEFDGRLCIAMELLEGRSLLDRLRDGPLRPEAARALLDDVLGALAALHARGLVHRDLKPSNVFLTPRGPVLLDFGLARDLRAGSQFGITQTGTVVGTPGYMAPEQALGKTVDRATDVFAAGLLLYEMLTGRPAFGGDSTLAVLYAIVNSDPPELEGEAQVFEPIVKRALAKNPPERYEDAIAMATALRALPGSDTGSGAAVSGFGSATAGRASAGAAGPLTPLPHLADSRGAVTPASGARPVTRVLAMPLRVVRPDPEIDYLAYSLPDAVAASLGALESLVIRTSATAAKFATYPLDLERIASEANVDVVLSGTLMRAGDRVRVNCQLIEVPGGTLIASHTCEAPLADLFQLEDDLGKRIVEELRLPLTAREHRLLGRDVPADPRAYSAYLRANQLMTHESQWGLARDQYLEAVRIDPQFAPAWARLGRAHRLLAKYGDAANSASGYTQAAEAFRRALELNPDLPAAHNLVTNLEVETGRALEAIERLLGRIRQRRADPELYAGLVTACRFAGLLDESARAFEIAYRLDPFVLTSVTYTYFLRGEYERAMAMDQDASRFSTALVLGAQGRVDEAVASQRKAYAETTQASLRTLLSVYIAAGSRDAEGVRQAFAAHRATAFRDPEGFCFIGRALAFAGVHDLAFEVIEKAVNKGFTVPSFLRTDRWLEPLRARPEFARVLAVADAATAKARETFIAGNGDALISAAPQTTDA